VASRRSRSSSRPARQRLTAQPVLETLEDRCVMDAGLWMAVFGGLDRFGVPDGDRAPQAEAVRDLLDAAGVDTRDTQVIQEIDQPGTFLIQTRSTVSQEALSELLGDVTGFLQVREYFTTLPFEEDHGPSTEPVLPDQHYLYNPAGYLTEATAGAAVDIALDFLRTNADQFGVTAADFDNVLVYSSYVTESTGITHVSFRQTVNGLEIENANIIVNVAADGRILNAGGGFVNDVARFRNAAPAPTASVQPEIDALQAVALAAQFLDVAPDGAGYVETPTGVNQASVVSAAGVSREDIKAQLQYIATPDGELHLTWNLDIQTVDGEHWYDLHLATATGEVVSLQDYAHTHATYNVFPQPMSSPSDGGRVIVSDPHVITPAPAVVPSPFGWHDTNGVAGAESTLTLGNNVSAYTDTNNDNLPDAGSQPDGGPGLNFNFALDLTQAPSTYRPAAVTNLFYWNNINHDIHYLYGFNEASRNFQTNNYGRGGLGGDAVLAEAQDGGGTNNANFATPPDGSAPRMQMYLWTTTTPNRDGDFDNEIIIHEYGHGVSNRLSGTGTGISALQTRGMGEGWSDWWSMMFTQKSAAETTAGRGMGTYALGQPTTGVGIRDYRYDWDITNVNLETFINYNVNSAVHAAGTRWASVLWDINHLLIQKYGYNPNVYDSTSPAGNIKALHLVLNGLKLHTSNNPTFLQARDAILQADMALYGGANQFELWTAFARRGLGFSASTASSSSTVLTTAFDMPPSLGPIQVTSTTPAVGSTVAAPPTSFVVNFNVPYQVASIQASDFTVNGTPATGFVLTDADTVTFTYGASPVVTQGLQTMAMVAGAVLKASDSSPSLAFSGQFRWDAVPLTVVSTSPPQVGGVFTLPGPFTYTVNFNEAVQAGSIGTADLVLSQGTVTGFSVIDADTAQYTISNISAEGAVTISLAAGQVLDAFGNANLAQAIGTYQIDVGTAAYPVPLAAKNPLGSLVYDPTVSGSIGTPGDTDNFTISIDPNQKITVFLDPAATLQGTIRLFDGSNVLLATTTSGAAGLDAVIQTVATGAGTQTYRIEVSGASGTTGTYTLGVVLNAREEDERRNGPANDTFATAEDINGSFVTLGPTQSRGAVLGTGTVGNNDYYQFAVTAGDTLTLALQSLSGGVVEVRLFDPSNNLLGQAVGGAANVSRLLSNLVAPVSGSYRALVTTTTTGTTYNLVVLKNADFDREANDSFAAGQFIGAADGALGYVVGGTSSATIESFDDGNITEYTGVFGAPVATVTAAAAHDGAFGLQTSTGTSDWFYRNDAAVQLAQGDTISVWVRPTAGVTGRAYFGFGASAAGTYSLVVGPNTSQLLLQLNSGFGFTTLASVSQTYTNNTWYRLEVAWGTGGVITGRLFASDGTTLLNTVTATDTTFTSGGIAFRAFTDGYQFDTVAKGVPGNVDWHTFAVNTGDVLTLTTNTPADGPGEAVNPLNPKIELYNPSNVLVASGTVLGDGRNEQIVHTATATGLYRVRVLGEGGTNGDYFVSIIGNTGTTAGAAFQVTATNPVNGANLLVAPATYTVDFNDAVLVASLQATDLVIDGSLTATGFAVVDGDTVSFTMPALANGLHTVTIAPGAILDAQGTPIQAFSATFTIDGVAPRVVATSVAPNGVLPPGNLTYTVTFSEPMRTTNLTSDDFTLHGNYRQAVGVNYAPSSFSFNGAGTVLTLNYVGLPDDDYTLTLNSSSVAFVDVVGNLLDGEFAGVFPSGNGVAGGNFAIGFDMDLATEAYPALVAKPPLGSLIYDPTQTRTIAFAGDVDSFTLNVDPGQTISVVVTPTTATATPPGLQPRVELFDPGNVSLGFASAGGPGQVTGIQTNGPTAGGTYRIAVSGLAGTQGLYTVQVILNAAFELEGKVAGATNNTRATAQDLTGSFIKLDTTLAHASRGAVSGVGTGDDDFYSFSLGAGQSVSAALWITTEAASVLYPAARTDWASGTGPTGVEYADLNADGNLDMIAVNNTSNNVGVRLGNGDGTFGALVNYAGLGVGARFLAVGDTNGDGRLDVVVSNQASNNVSLLLGNGNGTLQAATTYAVGATPFGVTTGDLNGDGRADVVVANFGTNDVSVLLGQAGGTLGAATNFATLGTNPLVPALGDLNGDGRLDLVVTNFNSASMSVLLGTGTGSFGPATTFALSANPWTVRLADVNNDGRLDALAASQGSSVVDVRLGTGTGSFGALSSFSSGVGGIRGLGVADVNGDGRRDVVVSSFANPGSTAVLLGTGTGTFGAAGTILAVGGSPNWLTLADVNNDGRPDVSTADFSSNTVSLRLNSFAPLVLELQDGSGAVLATGIAGSTNVNRVLNYLAPVAGTYYLRVSGGSGAYQAVVTRDAVFDAEANDTLATAQNATGSQGALGHMGTAAGGSQVVLNTLASTEANSGNGFPFHLTPFAVPSMRYQQIYAASQFAASGVIDTLRFRRDASQPTFGPTTLDVKITLSYAATTVAAPSATFAANVGAGAVTVFDGLMSISSTGSGAPNPFDIVLDVANLFNYNPANGDLLVDITMRNSPTTAFIDASSGIAGMSRVFATNATATVGTTGVAYGLMTRFDFVGAPAADWYKVTLGAGETVIEVETRTPADGPGQFVNALNPKIRVFDAGGVDITGAVTLLADGRNERVRVSGLTAGATYFVQVSGEGGTVGEYFVGVKALKTPTPTVLVDNTNPVAFRVFGAGWNTLTNPNDGDGGYGANARWHAGNGTSATYAEWRYGQAFTAGTSYEFYVTWDADPANASNATYSIYDGTTLIGTVVLDQKAAPNDAVVGATTWERLYVFTPATTGHKVISVRLSGVANGRVVADALFDPPLEGPGSAAAARFAATATTVGPAPAGRAFAALGTLDVAAGADPLGAARVETALVEPARAAVPRRTGRSVEARVSDAALADRAWLSSLAERPAVADLAVANADDDPADTLPTDDLQPANALLLAGRAQTLAADTLFRRASRMLDRSSADADADAGIDPALDGAQEGEEI